MTDSEYCSSSVDGAILLPNFCSHEVSSTVADLSRPRGLFVTKEDYLLVLERGMQRVVLMLFNDTDSTGGKSLYASHSIPLVSAPGINHGLAIDTDDEYIYATSSEEMFRWPRQVIQETVSAVQADPTTAATQFQINNEKRELVMDNMSLGRPGGNHITRTIVFDADNRIYISVGSRDNVDPDSFRAKIFRFDIADYNSTEFPIDLVEGEVFADGVRNEVGLEFDWDDVLWGVENGPDNLVRADLGENVNENNPAEELNRFLEPAKLRHNFYGYPYCWTEYNLTDQGLGRGTPWAWDTFIPEYDDAWCRDSGNVIKPMLEMQAHSAPLGLAFLKQPTASECVGGFPNELRYYLFVGFHGSWNRDVPTGHKIVYAPFRNGVPMGKAIDLFWSPGEEAPFESGLRPVDVVFDSCGRMLVSSDGTVDTGRGSKVFMITYHGNGSEFAGIIPDEFPYDPTNTTLLARLFATLIVLIIITCLLAGIKKLCCCFCKKPATTEEVDARSLL